MKRTSKILFGILALVLSIFSIACGGEPPHEHQFVNGICSCGETEHEHQYVNGICSCGDIKWGELLTEETLSNVTITTDEDLYIYRRQPVAEFPWFGNESGSSREYRTVKIANGMVEETYSITFIERVDDPDLFVLPIVQEGVFKGTEMSVSTNDKERPQKDEQLSNFERHFDIITTLLEWGQFTLDEQTQIYSGGEYISKMRNFCCDSIEVHEVKFKIENGRVTYLYFDIYVRAHDTVSTWNCDMKSTFIFSDYGTTVIE